MVKPRVGIVTLTQAENYGSVLQAYATRKIFESLSDELDFELAPLDSKPLRLRRVLSLVKPEQGRRPRARVRNFLSMRAFIKPLLDPSVRYLNIGDPAKTLDHLRDRYDALIVGSDEMWKLYSKGSEQVFFLPPGLTRYQATYATSANRVVRETITQEERVLIAKSFRGLDFVSVRDTNTANFVNDFTGGDVRTVEIIDPTLTYGFPEFPPKPVLPSSPSGKQRVLLMVRSAPIARAIVDEFGGRTDVYSAFWGHSSTRFLRIDPAQFLTVFAEFDAVVTDFFHGTCMSIRSGKPFVSFDDSAHYSGVESKIENVLRKLGLSDSYLRVTPTDSSELVSALRRRLDPSYTLPADSVRLWDDEREKALQAARQISAELERALVSGSDA